MVMAATAGHGTLPMPTGLAPMQTEPIRQFVRKRNPRAPSSTCTNATPERCTNCEYLTSHSCGEEKVVVVSCLGAE
jgi:hypothetical protein